MARHPATTTIAVVAARAGVSTSTVSRVMNGRFVGDPQIADRVRAVAADLRYSPSHTARSLALGQTKAIAFVVPDLANPAFQALLAGLSKTAARDGYRVLVADSAESREDEPFLAAEIRRRCDAIVLCSPRMDEAELVALAEELHPLVIINRASDRIDAPSLRIDYEAGIRALASHLYELGHRRFAYLEGAEGSVSNAYRLRGLADFERDHPDVRILRTSAGVNTEDGLATARGVADSGATAALAYNDLVAIGLIGGLHELGLRVPEDVSVTGFDDIPFARYMTPPLTTASVPHETLGEQAWHRMLELIRGEEPKANAVFGPRIKVRGSTAAPAREAVR